MKLASRIALFCVALLHVWFFVLETFLWRTPLAAKTLAMSAEEARATAILAGNLGVYNAVVGAGLFWSLFERNPILARKLRWFFLLSVLAVGAYGVLSARVLVLFVQVLPALLALTLTTIASRSEKVPSPS
ncbi:MAG: DUF1304 domain-containing protein [Polyangiaceae bacterium]